MHNCKATRETLIALALEPHDQTQSLPAELEACTACREEYAALRSLLRVVDEAKQSALPAESFWPGYNTRLRQRLETESNSGLLLPTTEKRISPRTLLGNFFSSSVRVPIPLAAVLLIFLGVSLVFALNSRRPLSAPPPLVVSKTVEAPVIQERIRENTVTRVIYRERQRRQPAGARTNLIAGRQKASATEPPMSLVGFKPTNEVQLTIIKGSYQR
ncbi:MAG: hypothetical protein QOE96_3958 [Blastocatellia bacterium]|jgi:hypothetical protein|nr:hypothetical protein [Blastocatellia bacterium]